MSFYMSATEYGLPEPEIKEMNGGIEVILHNNILQSNTSETIRKHFGNISEAIRKQFGKDIALTFELIQSHPEITAEQIAEKIGKTPRTIENYLAKLKDSGKIVRKGPKLGGYWLIIE